MVLRKRFGKVERKEDVSFAASSVAVHKFILRRSIKPPQSRTASMSIIFSETPRRLKAARKDFNRFQRLSNQTSWYYTK